MVAELRYRPSGRIVPLQDTIHLFPSPDDPDSREIIAAVTGINLFVIEAGDSNHRATDTLLLPAAMDVVAILPRARNECRSMRLTALLPDAEDDFVILDIPDWNMHWRSHFILKEPLHLPAGTRLQSTFIMDNSTTNPRNPFDPPEDMRHGPAPVRPPSPCSVPDWTNLAHAPSSRPAMAVWTAGAENATPEAPWLQRPNLQPVAADLMLETRSQTLDHGLKFRSEPWGEVIML